MENEITKLAFSSIDIFRPSLLVGNRVKPRVAEVVGGKTMNALSPLMHCSLSKYRAIQAKTVADVMAQCVLSPKKGTRVYLSDRIQKIADFPLDGGGS